MTPQVSVVILNWNGRHLLPDCLAALDTQTFRDFEVIVVDNGSQDGSPEWLAAQYPAVRLLKNTTNLGFAAANNQGLRASQAPLILLLNNDAQPAPGCLQALVGAAAHHTWAAMFACKILQQAAPDRMDSAGIEVDRAGVAWNCGWDEAATEHIQPLEVFGPSGAAAFYRRELLDQIGLLDDDFFAYYEDVDLAWRAQWAGYRCLYVPEATATHIHSATAGRGSAFKVRLLGRNKWWAIAKNYPYRALWYDVPLLLAVDAAAVLAALARDRNLNAVRGRWQALRGWRQMWRKRASQPYAQVDWRKKLSAVVWQRWRQRTG